MTRLPEARVRVLADRPVRPEGEFVLYWMIAERRLVYNFALERARALAEELARPVLIFEALSCSYPFASDRMHAFVIQGMAEHAHQLARSKVGYLPYIEPRPGAGKGLLAALSQHACAIVTDERPGLTVRLLERARTQVAVRMEAVDSSGIYPVRATTRVFTTAASFRRHLHTELDAQFARMPVANPLARGKFPRMGELPPAIRTRWPARSPSELSQAREWLGELPIDHAVGATGDQGGTQPARARLADFLEHRLAAYATERNHPDANVGSDLSPYLHFGHISSHEVFQAVVEHEQWTPMRLGGSATGSRTGWWGMSASAEAFLDQLLTWREIGLNMACHEPAYQRYESLPEWARTTLDEHRGDTRPHLYSARDLAEARTHDPLWNAAQTELLREGRIHNYLRMLWGKKILQWSPTPEQALETMIELNDRYALDGRDANSYSGIFWCLGRYDRAWGPERPIFGKVRYMTSASAARKLRLSAYLRRHAPPEAEDA